MNTTWWRAGFWGAVALMTTLNACSCEDVEPNPWDLNEEFPEEPVEPDPIEPDPIEPDPPEVELVETPPDLDPDTPWEPEVIQEVTRQQALNDRTSIDVGDDGTIWLGYHSCDDLLCNDAWLSVVHRQPNDTEWIFEKVAPQYTTFGLSVYRNQPFVAYLDIDNFEFRIGERSGATNADGDWGLQALDVDFSGQYDGLDLTHDGSRMYVTFAGDNSRLVDLFVRDMTDPAADFTKLRSLEVRQGASAALERGLQADGKGNLFLVHRDGRDGPYGVARFRLRDNIWDRITYLPSEDIVVSSMVARNSGDICMSSGLYDELLFTCGRLTELERDYELLGEPKQSYSSLIEGRDGSLIIAYNYGDNEKLKIARLYPNGEWDVRTAFDGPSYGVSTGIDLENKLLISYYTCRGDRCTLEMLRQPY